MPPVCGFKQPPPFGAPVKESSGMACPSAHTFLRIFRHVQMPLHAHPFFVRNGAVCVSPTVVQTIIVWAASFAIRSSYPPAIRQSGCHGLTPLQRWPTSRQPRQRRRLVRRSTAQLPPQQLLSKGRPRREPLRKGRWVHSFWKASAHTKHVAFGQVKGPQLP